MGPLLLLLVSPRLGSHGHRPGLAACSGHLQERRGSTVLSQPGPPRARSWCSPFPPQPLQPGSNHLPTPLKDPRAPARDAQGLGKKGNLLGLQEAEHLCEETARQDRPLQPRREDPGVSSESQRGYYEDNVQNRAWLPEGT